MASLRARHRSVCALGPRETTAPSRERDKIPGCTCKPTYSIRGASGNGHERVGHDLRDAIRALHKRNVMEDEGQPVVRENIGFDAWADRWFAGLELKQTTKVGYAVTVGYAKEALRSKRVRKLTPADVADFSRFLRELGVSDSTRAKHLRILGACLQSAFQHGYASYNPVPKLPRGEKPRHRKQEPSYFEDAELPKLVAAHDDPLWRTILLLAIYTGMRLGELTGLIWPDVDLTGSVIHVRRTVTADSKRAIVSAPKSHEKREVELTTDAVKLLGKWWGLSRDGAYGRSARVRGYDRRRCIPDVPFNDSELVFPRFGVGGFLPAYALRDTCLYAAMKRAGIPQVGPTPSPRTFHSLRHTYARICLEHGCLETWLQRQLGHSSLAVTTGIYGHWSKAARKVQAAKLEGAFSV